MGSSKNLSRVEVPNFCQISIIEGADERSMGETNKSRLTEHFLREENMHLR